MEDIRSGLGMRSNNLGLCALAYNNPKGYITIPIARVIYTGLFPMSKGECVDFSEPPMNLCNMFSRFSWFPRVDNGLCVNLTQTEIYRYLILWFLSDQNCDVRMKCLSKEKVILLLSCLRSRRIGVLGKIISIR